MSTTIRVSENTRDRFSRLASETGRPMTQLLDEAADALERRFFFDQMNRRFDELRSDDDTWDEIQTERGVEDQAIRDESE